MYIILKQLHSFTAYFAILFLVIAITWSFYGWFSKKNFTKTSKNIILLGLIGTHVQMLIGIVIYFVSPLGWSNFSGEAMKNSLSRLYILEHPILMLLGIGLITYSYSKSKRNMNSHNKFRVIAIFYSLGLIAILLRVPWKVWMN